MIPRKIYCHGEADSFPEEEFKRDKKNRLVHKAGIPHYAATGEPVSAGIHGIEGAYDPIDEVAAEEDGGEQA
jgi:hypothetical protein